MIRKSIFRKLFFSLTFIGVLAVMISFGLERDLFFKNLLFSALAISSAIGLIAFVLAKIIAGNITTPLERIKNHALEFSGKKYGSPVKMIDRQDEVGGLARALNDMYTSLSEELEFVINDNEKLDSILGAMVEGVLAIDADEKVIFINETAARSLNIKAHKSMGKPVWEIARNRPLNSAILKALHEGIRVIDHVKIVDELGDHYFKIYISSINFERKEQRGAVVVLQDITTLEKLASQRNDLIANISHELKTPLTAIKAITETILSDKDMKAKQREVFLQRIISQSNRLTDLATNVLELSRIEYQKEGILVCRHSLNELLDRVFDDFREYAENKQIRLERKIPEKEITAVCQAEAVIKVAENLLDNAIKFTPEGGEIDFGLRSDDEKATFYIRDDGFGIAEDEQGRVFERFYRTRKARKIQSHGSGLGLAIIKSLVDSNDWQIEIESIPGKGTQIDVTLPLK